MSLYRHMARAVVGTFDTIIRATGIEPTRDVVTIHVHPETYADLQVEPDTLDQLRWKYDAATDRQRLHILGYIIEPDTAVPPGGARVVVHHEIDVAIR